MEDNLDLPLRNEEESDVEEELYVSTVAFTGSNLDFSVEENKENAGNVISHKSEFYEAGAENYSGNEPMFALEDGDPDALNNFEYDCHFYDEEPFTNQEIAVAPNRTSWFSGQEEAYDKRLAEHFRNTTKAGSGTIIDMGHITEESGILDNTTNDNFPAACAQTKDVNDPDDDFYVNVECAYLKKDSLSVQHERLDSKKVVKNEQKSSLDSNMAKMSVENNVELTENANDNIVGSKKDVVEGVKYEIIETCKDARIKEKNNLVSQKCAVKPDLSKKKEIVLKPTSDMITKRIAEFTKKEAIFLKKNIAAPPKKGNDNKKEVIINNKRPAKGIVTLKTDHHSGEGDVIRLKDWARIIYEEEDAVVRRVKDIHTSKLPAIDTHTRADKRAIANKENQVTAKYNTLPAGTSKGAVNKVALQAAHPNIAAVNKHATLPLQTASQYKGVITIPRSPLLMTKKRAALKNGAAIAAKTDASSTAKSANVKIWRF